MFADDAKFYCARISDDNVDFVHTLRNFVDWARVWQMSIAFQKCFVLSAGNLTVPKLDYVLGDVQLASVNTMRDLGILVSSDLKFSEHCSKIAASAYVRASCMLKVFSSANPYWLIRAFNTYVRPILEFNSQVFNPYLQRDIECIERVLRYFTRAVCFRAGLCFTDYVHRLKLLHVQSLEHRRLISDLCLVYKIFYGLVDLEFEQFFIRRISHYNTRHAAYNSCLLEPVFAPNTDVLRNFFAYRVINPWNYLSDHVVLSRSLSIFRSRISDCDLSPFCQFY